jgi:hypothetical protein
MLDSAEVVGMFELLDLRVHRVVRRPFDKNGKHVIPESFAGRNERQHKNHPEKKVEAKMKADHEDFLARIDAETTTIQAKTKVMRGKRMQAYRKANQEEMMARMREDIKFWPSRDEIHN